MANRHALHAATATLWHTMLALLATFVMLGTTIAIGVPQQALAAEPNGTHTTHSNAITTSSATHTGTVSISIEASTAVVTSQSGYHVTATITNGANDNLPEGTLTVSTNALYTFNSRTDMQQWAQGDVRIPTPNQLGQVNVPAITATGSATVALDVAADDAALASFTTWGPKPVMLIYRSNGRAVVTNHTFLTRSSDGLTSANTPALNITVALPLTTDSWHTDDEALNTLVRDDQSTQTPIVIDANTLKTRQQTITKHPGLQVIADPTYLRDMAVPTKSAGIMQPGWFDINTYTALGEQAYASTGITSQTWNAETGLRTYQTALGDNNATARTYAWQGAATWNTAALTMAKQHGYDTVIATNEYDNAQTPTVHTGTIVVPTSAGPVTVLCAQTMLTTLANGDASSRHADSEQTSAGRIARFMAQSAFYQMEQPYATRNLLVTLSDTIDDATLDTLMSNIEQAGWLKLTDMDALLAATPYAQGENATAIVDEDGGPSRRRSEAVTAALQTLAQANTDLTRFKQSILNATATSDSGNANQNGSATKEHAGDPQALARQDARNSAQKTTNPNVWLQQLHTVLEQYTLHALSGDNTINTRMLNGAQQLIDQLLNGVSITPLENVTIVTETAKMPVTVSNDHPYPVTVVVSSLTDSMELVTSRKTTLEVPAHGEAQAAIAIRAATSGSATATITLLDRNGNAFGNTQNTTITSTLRISDMSGFIIIIGAIALGLLGLWRQFHRIKDPDE